MVTLALVMVAGGCAMLRPPPIALLPVAQPATTPVFDTAPLSRENAAGLSELGQVEHGAGDTLAAVEFTPDGQEMLTVGVRSGTLKRWRLEKGRMVLRQTMGVGPVGLGAVSFDRDRKQIAVGAAGVDWERHRFGVDRLGHRVWDATTGDLIYEQATEPDIYGGCCFASRVLLTPDAVWTLEITAVTGDAPLGMKNLFCYSHALQQVCDGYVNLDRQAEEDDYDVIALDAAGELLAAADQSGKVIIFPFHPPAYPEPKSIGNRILQPAGDIGATPLALAFDPRRRWLARVRGAEVIVWDLQAEGYPRHLQASAGDKAGKVAAISFSPDGELMAVGAVTGWQIWDVAGRRKLMEETDTPVYALAFSPDGRTLAVGGASGVVHLWGVVQ